MATQYTVENARKALPHLVRCAELRNTITYRDLSDRIGVHWRAAPHLLGYIRDDICQSRRLPLISAIVINGSTRLPGESFLPEGTAGLSTEAYRQAFEELRDRVFECTQWDALLQELGLPPLQRSPGELDVEGREHSLLLDRRGGAGEGEGHRRLKEWVAANPHEFGIGTDESGQIEFNFISGDSCDVVFETTGSEAVVIEVKNGERGELVRGVYQAVKYRALLAAERGHGDAYPVQAHLVAYSVPDDIQQFAAKLGVETHAIARERLDA